jgi:nitronate monooxygenase
VQRALFAPVRAAAEKANDPAAMQMWAGQAARLAAAEPAGALAARLWEESRALLP